MNFTEVDGYLLGDAVAKGDVISAFLSARSDQPEAAPFYRALEAVGERAADEAFIALRLVLAGRPPTDANVRRLRALAGVARAVATADARKLSVLRKRDAAVLSDLPLDGAMEPLREAARRAYRAELQS